MPAMTSYHSPWTSDHRGWAVPTCQTPGLCQPDKRITLNKLIGVTGTYLSLHKRNRMFTGDVQSLGPSGAGGGLEVFAHGPGHRVVGAEVALAVG